MTEFGWILESCESIRDWEPKAIIEGKLFGAYDARQEGVSTLYQNTILGWYDIAADSVLYRKELDGPVGVRVISKNTILGTTLNNQTLEAYNHDFEKLWALDVSELGRYYDNISREYRSGEVRDVVYHEPSNTFVVSVAMGWVLGLDADTGAVRWKCAVRYYPLLTLHHAEVFGVGHHPDYQCINVDTGEMLFELALESVWKNTPASIKSHWPANIDWKFKGLVTHYITRPAITDKHLIVTDMRHQLVCLLDKYTAEIQEVLPLPGAKEIIPSHFGPQVQGNRLFQLDGDHTLHIFEREDGW